MPRVRPLLIVLAAASQLAAQDPRQVVRAATRAVEGDSADALAARWSARLVADSTDEEALLGLATIARLTYRFDLAHQLVAPLIDAPGSDSNRWAIHARLLEAHALTAQARFGAADSLLALVAAQAHASGDRAAEAEALLGRAVTQIRITGPPGVEVQLRRARTLIPVSDTALDAAWHCSRAALLAGTERMGAQREARIGTVRAERAREQRIALGCRFLTARLMLSAGKSLAAADSMGRIAAAFASIHDIGDEAAALQWQAYALTGVGEYGAARHAALAAVKAGRVSGNLSAVAWAELNLTGIAFLFGDLESASRTLAEADSLFVRQGDNWGLATLQGYKAGLAESNGDLAGARTIFQSELARVEEFDPDAAIEAHVQLASIARREGDFSTAAAELGAAHRIATQQGMKGWQEALAFYDGMLALARGDLVAAEADLRRHLRTLGPRQLARRYVAETRLAEVYARRGNLAAAEDRLTAATDSLESWRASLDDQALRLQVFGTREQDLDPNVGVAFVLGSLAGGGRAPAAFALAERRRGRMLLDEMVRLAALQTDTSTLISAVNALRRSVTPLNAGAVMRALPNDSTAIIEYIAGRGDAPTTAFVITRFGLRAYLMPGLDSLAPAIGRLSALLATGSDAIDLRRRLGSAYLKSPVADLPPGIHHIVIVPDDALYRLPYEALLLGDDQPLVARYGLTLEPSVAVMLRLRRRPIRKDAPDLLALGDPRFGGESPERESGEAQVYRDAFAANGGLPRLAGSALEARDVARFAPRAEVRLREAASEAWLKGADLQVYRVLHFATHALVDEHSATRTALALAPGDGEDGFMGPGDLAALRLRADLVVLSACRTAGGVIVGGEGIQGLTAPLLQAGARTVLATEWPIEDRSTLSLVERFYGGLADGLTADQALRGAQLAALRRGAPPAVWAAFTLVGDPLLRVPLRRPIRLHWWWVAGLLAVLLLSYGLVRVKRTGAERG